MRLEHRSDFYKSFQPELIVTVDDIATKPVLFLFYYFYMINCVVYWLSYHPKARLFSI